MERVRYIESRNVNPDWNLALEEFVFQSLDSTYQYFMLWQNHNTIVVGKNQNTVEQINAAYVQEHGIRVVRRCSGGGAVYHDMGNLNFTFIMDAPKLEALNFQMFCQPVIQTLAGCGVDAELTGRNDMTIQGKKFSGNSQYIAKHRVMHHGTIMFQSDLSVLGQALQVPKDKIQSKGIQSVRSRVTNVADHLQRNVSLAEFKERLVEQVGQTCILERYELTPEDLAQVDALCQAKYATWAWNYGYSPKYEITKQRRIEGCGLVEISMEVEQGKITRIQFLGDFFGSGDLAELSQILEGCLCQKEALEQALFQVDISWYVHQLRREDLIALILL